MPEVIDIIGECPSCGTPHMVGRAMAGAGQTYIPDATVVCKCGTVYIVSAAMLRGSLAPVHVFAVPIAGGDAGGLDALLIGDLPARNVDHDHEWPTDEDGHVIIPMA